MSKLPRNHVIILLLLLALPLTAQSIALPGLEKEGIFQFGGTVKRMVEEGWTSEGRLFSRTVNFSEDGKPLEERYTNGDSSPGSWIEFHYDETGRLSSKIFHHPDAPVPDTEIYTWQEDRLFSVARIFTTGKYGWRYEYHYDQAGRIAKAVKIDRYWKDVVVWTKEFVYDESGRLVEVNGGGLDENIQWREVFSYRPGSDMPWEKKRWNARGEITSISRYEFDRKGHLLSEKEVTPGGEEWGELLFRYRYDEKGNWTEKILGLASDTSDGDFFNPTSWYTRRYEYN